MSHWFNPNGQWTSAWAKSHIVTRELGRTRPLVSFPLLKKVYDKFGLSWVTLHFVEDLDQHIYDRMRSLTNHNLLELSPWREWIYPNPTRGQKHANWWRLSTLGLLILAKFYDVKDEHSHIVSKYWLDPEGDKNEAIVLDQKR
jgi:hypothetical protein